MNRILHTERKFPQQLLALAVGAALSTTALADGRIAGQLTAQLSGMPLQGSRVKLEEINVSTVTARDGRYVLAGIAPGSYTLTVSYLGVETMSRQVTVQDNETLVSNFAVEPVTPEAEYVIVLGQSGSLNKALNRQRSADNVVSAVAADAIGQLPDTNVSEALQRLPGLSVERDQGEGRYVRVRGLGPDYNAVTINGVSLPSPDSGRRAVALDVIPSDLLEGLVVTKTLTPDMDANALGGSIDIQSLSAFDRDGFFYSFNAEGSYNDLVEKTSPKLALTASDQFSLGDGTDNLGIAAGISWYDREFGSENLETGGGWDFDDEALLEEVAMRDYRITRERAGLTLNIDYKLSDNTDLYWRNLYSEYTDSEIRQANTLEFEEAVSVTEAGAAEVERELKDRIETQKILSSSLGGSTRAGSWTFDYRVALSKSSEDEPQGIGGAVFAGDEAFEPVSFAATDIPRLSLPATFMDAGQYALDEVELAASKTTDKDNSLQLDISKEFFVGKHSAEIKFGGKYNDRNKDNDVSIWVFEDFDEYGFTDDDLLLTQFSGGEQDYSLGSFGPDVLPGAVYAAIEPLDAEEFFSEEDSRIEDFDVNETVSAAYVMGRIDLADLRILAGVRYEDTDFNATGTYYDGEEFSGNQADNQYDHWLPSVHLRYLAGKDTQLRGSWTNTLVRPNFEQLAPYFVIDDEEAAFGNPLLEPLESSNLDVGVEHYMGLAGVVSMFAYYKDIENFIYQTDLAGTQAYSDFDEAITFANGEDAEVYGVELNFSKQFSELPAPFNGLLLTANATFSDSRATLEYLDEDSDNLVSRHTPLPSQSDTTGNLSLGYESSRFSMRIAANYKSEYLLEVQDVSDEDYDVYVDKQLQLDLSARFYVTEGVQVYVEALNLTDEPYYAYVEQPAYNAQYETYGLTYKLGLTITNF